MVKVINKIVFVMQLLLKAQAKFYGEVHNGVFNKDVVSSNDPDIRGHIFFFLFSLFCFVFRFFFLHTVVRNVKPTEQF